MLIKSKFTKSLAVLGLSAFAASPALAADPGTYRAGQTYLKTVATAYGQCEIQCRGDAQCRSWNYVKVNPRAASGICEFNSRNAQMTASPISISGVVSSAVDPMMSRAIQGGSNTVRVGNPVMPNVANTQQARNQRAPSRIVNRRPVPQQKGFTKQATIKRPAPRQMTAPAPSQAAPSQTPQQARRAPRVYGDPSQVSPQASVPKQSQQTPQAALTPAQMQRNRQEFFARQQQAYARQQQQQAPRAAMPQQRPQQRSGQQPQQRPQQQAIPQARPIAPQQAAQQQAFAPQQPAAGSYQNNLYGSLHDDLTKIHTPVARPMPAPDNLNNPDAPMSTTRILGGQPMPTKPVQTGTLPPARAIEQGLAGGQ